MTRTMAHTLVRYSSFMLKGYESKVKGVLQNDELVQALKSDPTSNEYISQRVKEIVEDTVVAEKDRHIQG